MRNLITVAPLMYREALALAFYQDFPEAEVMIGSLGRLDGQAENFTPHLLIRNDTDGANMSLRIGALCWIEVLESNGLNARIRLDGEVWEIEDISIEDLLGLVKKAEKLIPGQLTE